MAELFLKILNMSISAGWLVLAVLALRLVLKKTPKWVNVLLWGIVAVRLICPFSIESVLSLIPSGETISPEIMLDPTPSINTGVDSINRVVNPIITESFAPSGFASANPLQIWIPVAAYVWIIGMALMVLYTAISYWRVAKQVGTAVLVRDNIWECEFVPSPFILGVADPRIYLPTNLEPKDLHNVIAHEEAHIRRKDHWWKPLGFLLLTIHWFNPLMWIAYILLCRDIELACDEKVIRQMETDQRADYSEALLACSVHRKRIAACPLAFGEVGVKERVRSVLNYKKPGFWIVLVAVIVCVAVAVTMLTDPITPKTPAVIFEGMETEDIQWMSLTYWGTETQHLTLNSKMEARLLEILKSLKPKDFEELRSAGSTYRSGQISLMIYCGDREILLHYDGEAVTFTFDSDTAELFGDLDWGVRSEALNGFFDEFGYSMDRTSVFGAESYNIQLVEAKAYENVVWGIVEMVVPDEILLVENTAVLDLELSCNGTLGKSGSYSFGWDKDNRTVRIEFAIEVNVISPGLASLTFDIGDRNTNEVLEESVSIVWMVEEVLEAKTYTASSAQWEIELTVAPVYLELDAQFASPETLEQIGDTIEIVLKNGKKITVDDILSGRESDTSVSLHTRLTHNVVNIDNIEEIYVGGIKLEEGYAQLQSGRSYVFMDPQDDLLTSSHLQLYSDFTFSFSFSPVSSYLGVGNYEITDGKVILHTDDGYFHYTFKLAGEDLIFVAEESSEQVWFSGLTDGSIMRYISEE